MNTPYLGVEDRTGEGDAPDYQIVFRAKDLANKRTTHIVQGAFAGVPFASTLYADDIGVEFKTRGEYTIAHWDFTEYKIEADHAFLLDEKTGKELICRESPAGIIVETERFQLYAYSQYDLVHCLHRRGYRKLKAEEEPTEDDKKAKWQLTLLDAVPVPTIEEGAYYILREASWHIQCATQIHRQYYGEKIRSLGIPRTEEHRAIDQQQISR